MAHPFEHDAVQLACDLSVSQECDGKCARYECICPVDDDDVWRLGHIEG